MDKCHYTFGRVISEPTARTSKSGKAYTSVYVELFGGMRSSAIAGTQITKGMFVAVKMTQKANGQAAYNAVKLNDDAEAIIRGAARFLDADTSTCAADDDEELLPF